MISRGDPPACIRRPTMKDPATLYYLRVDHGGRVAFKIGITRRPPCDVLDRYPPADRKRVTVLRVWRYKLRKWAKAHERAVCLTHHDDRYTGPDLLTSGNSELFSVDVLGLDKA